jgi:hypothetical protein
MWSRLAELDTTIGFTPCPKQRASLTLLRNPGASGVSYLFGTWPVRPRVDALAVEVVSTRPSDCGREVASFHWGADGGPVRPIYERPFHGPHLVGSRHSRL